MPQTFIQVSIPLENSGEAGLLVALLSEAGFDGFEETATTLNAFTKAEQFDESALSALLGGRPYETESIAETNWNAQWESSFEPVIIDDFCAIRAAFHQPVTTVQHEIIITPQMSFGTGHHATTRLMAKAMRRIDFTNRRVFDFGTGTGILAILAHKSGAAAVWALDNDDWSIANAADNLAANGAGEVVLEKGTTLPANQQFDILLANINKHILLENMQAMQQALLPGGTALLSGLLLPDREDITRSAAHNGLQINAFYEEDGWICLQFDCK
jgi:ribosomal protein L11 methyltransferase